MNVESPSGDRQSDAVSPRDGAAATEKHFDEVITGPCILWSGAIRPEAHLERLVHAYHLALTYVDPDLHLIVAGRPAPGPDAVPTDEHHAAVLVDLAVDLCLTQSWIVADPPDAVFAVMARRATVHLVGPMPAVRPSVLAEHLLDAVSSPHR